MNTKILATAMMVLSYYLIQVISDHKVLPSISKGDYLTKKPWKWIFEFVLAYSGLSLILVSLDGQFTIHWPKHTFLFISGIGIIGVAIFSRYKKSIIYEYAHYTCASIGIGSMIASIGFDFNRWHLLPIPLIMLGLTLWLSGQKVKIKNIEINGIWATAMVLVWVV